MIIDDKTGIRELFALELASAGYGTVGIGEVESVKDKIKTSKPDVVLLDLYLQGSHRWDVLIDIKKNHPRLPVIVMTGFDNYRNDPRLLFADGYLIKSFYFEDLIQKIKSALRSKQDC